MASAVMMTAFVPGAPLLVPGLGPQQDRAITELRRATLAAVSALVRHCSSLVVLAAGERDDEFADAAGTFAGYGVDIAVRLAPSADLPVSDMPGAALIAGWLRGQCAPEARWPVRLLGPDSDVVTDDVVTDIARNGYDGVLAIGDGATTLTAASPGYFQPGAAELQQRVTDALATGDTAAFTGTGLPAIGAAECAATGMDGFAGWRAAAALMGPDVRATELYRDAPFGVGYYVGTWERDQ